MFSFISKPYNLISLTIPENVHFGLSQVHQLWIKTKIFRFLNKNKLFIALLQYSRLML